MKIIDVHTHIYPDAIAPKAVENIKSFYNIPYAAEGDGTIGTLLDGARRHNVQKIVVCSVATKAHQVHSINNYMAQQLANPIFVPLATLHPDMERAEIVDEVARITELGLKGIKLHPDCQAFKLNGDKARMLLDAVGDFEMPILVHTGDKRFDRSHPTYMVEIARDYPSLTFIAAHFGGWSEWDEAMKYKGLKNVMFDTSSTLAYLDPHIAKVVMLGLGIEKFMYGTDYPMWSYDKEIDRVLALNLGEENNELVFRKNAEKLFGIKAE